TNVGAALRRDAPRGRRSIYAPPQNSSRTDARFTPPKKKSKQEQQVQLFWLSMLVHTSKGVFVY
ncbi:hypothetical protein, partial [Pseudomonas alloputida]|uniref:hypothetical protein n=1 Tax=Pseudomonas alloputida TaxID=1940621 RepID=UPI001CC1FB0C